MKNKSRLILVLLAILIILSVYNNYLIRNSRTNSKEYILLGDFRSINKEKLKKYIKTNKCNFESQNYVFLGDSITDFYDLDKYYPNMPVVNSGINGDTTSNILKDMNNRVYQYNPTKIFLLIGTNDLTQDDTETVYQNITKLISEIRKNRECAVIYLESIYPVNKSVNKGMVKNRTNDKIIDLNKKLKKFASNKTNVKYIDLFDILKNEKGLLNEDYTNDGLHLNDEGYKKVTNILKKYM